MDVEVLRALVKECGLAANSHHQPIMLTTALKGLLGSKEPHREQVKAVRRMVYGFGDTILIAKTGFGKSICLHAYSVLTINITQQIIPLSKLGNEQLDAISRYKGTQPVLVTAETRLSHPSIFKDIARGMYTHILLGPEQAVFPAFSNLFLIREFASRVQLVAIDECHVIRQWETFRAEYTMFQQLRRVLDERARFFGCTAY